MTIMIFVRFKDNLKSLKYIKLIVMDDMENEQPKLGY